MFAPEASCYSAASTVIAKRPAPKGAGRRRLHAERLGRCSINACKSRSHGWGTTKITIARVERRLGPFVALASAALRPRILASSVDWRLGPGARYECGAEFLVLSNTHTWMCRFRQTLRHVSCPD